MTDIEEIQQQLLEVTTKSAETSDLVMRLAQLVSGVMSALVLAFEEHYHDEYNKVKLPEEVQKIYNDLIPNLKTKTND